MSAKLPTNQNTPKPPSILTPSALPQTNGTYVGAAAVPVKPSQQRVGTGSSLWFDQLEDRLVPTTDTTALEQLMVELVNRARANPTAEATRFNIDLNEGVPAELRISPDPKQPLAPNQNLLDTIRDHLQDLIQNPPPNDIAHESSDGTPFSTRILNGGYNWNQPGGAAGENLAFLRNFNFTDSSDFVEAMHEFLFVDAGVDDRGHRVNILQDVFREIGSAVTFVTATNSVYSGQDFGSLGDSGDSFLTGVAYTDLVVADDFYTVGEGLANVTITAFSNTGASFSTTTGAAGGYSLELPNGTYIVTASGGSLNGTIVRQISINNRNVKADFTPDQVSTVNPLILTLPNLGNNDVTIRRNGDIIEVVQTGTSNRLGLQPLATTSQILINGAASVADTVRIDLSGGSFSIPDGIRFSGGTGNQDQLFFVAGSIDAVQHNLTSSLSGASALAGLNVEFVGVEQVVDLLAATSRTISYDQSNSLNLQLQDDASANDGVAQLTVSSGSISSVLFVSNANQTTIRTGAGNDTISVADFADVPNALTLDGAAGSDTLDATAIDNAITLIGGTGNDILRGSRGNTSYQFADNWGNDLVEEVSNGGNDSLLFATVTESLLFDISDRLAIVAVNNPNLAVTHLGSNVENLTAGQGNDQFVLSANRQLALGNGSIDGGAGINSLAYPLRTTPVTVDLANGTAGDVGQLRNVQQVFTGSGADTLIGDGANNTLLGGAGADTVQGGDGLDQLQGHNAAGWREQVGNVQPTFASPNRLTIQAATGFATLEGIQVSDVSLSMNVALLASGPDGNRHIGLVARHQGSGHDTFVTGLIVRRDGALFAEIWRANGGLLTRLDSQPLSSAAGQLRFDAVGRNLRLFLNDQLLAAASDSTVLAAGRVGVRGTQDQAIDSFTVNPLTATVGSLPFADDFAPGTGNTLSGTWTEQQGYFLLNNGDLVPSAAGINLATVNGLALADSIVSTTVSFTGSSNAHVGLVARYGGPADTNLYLGLVARRNGNWSAEIWRSSAGLWTKLSESGIAPLSAGTQLTFAVIGSTLTFFVDGDLATSAVDSQIQRPGLAGVRGSTGIRLAEFQLLQPSNSAIDDPLNDSAQYRRDFVPLVGDFTPDSGAATASSANENVMLNRLIHVADVRVQSAYNLDSVGNSHLGLVARHQGDRYYLGLIARRDGQHFAELWKAEAGQFTRLGSSMVTGGTVGTLTLTVRGNLLNLALDDTTVVAAADGSIQGTGQTGVRGSANTRFSSFAAQAVPISNFTDDFTDASSFPGSNWQVPVGQANLSGGGLQGLAALNLVTNTVTVARDVRVTTQYLLGSGNQHISLVARHAGQGDQDLYLGMLVRREGQLAAELWRNVASVYTRLVSNPIFAPNQGELEFRVQGNSLQLLVQGNLAAAATDSALQGAGQTGLRFSAGVSLGNFTASNLVPTLVTDDFDRGNLGTNYRNLVGALGLANGTAGGSGPGLHLAAVQTPSLTDASASVQLEFTNGPAENAFAGLGLRYTGTGDDNMLFGLVARRSGVLFAEIWHNVQGTWTLLTSRAIGTGTNGRLTFTVTGNWLAVAWNDAIYATALVNEMPQPGQTTLRLSGGVRLDNLEIDPNLFA